MVDNLQGLLFAEQTMAYVLGDEFHLIYYHKMDPVTDAFSIEIQGPHPDTSQKSRYLYCLIERVGEHGNTKVNAPVQLPKEIRTVLSSLEFFPEVKRMLYESELVEYTNPSCEYPFDFLKLK